MGRSRLWPARGAVLLLALLCPRAARAQFAAVEAFLRNVTDLSFYGGLATLTPGSDRITTRGTLGTFGVEMLFEIASIDRPDPTAPPPRRDTTRMVLTRMEVRRAEGRLDTLYVYEPRTPAASRPATERVWTFEMGIGYGQYIGFNLGDPGLDLRGSIRDLPSASVYASYEPIGVYGGLRSGLMKTQGLQVIERSTGNSADGNGEAFFSGAMVGYAIEVSSVNFFLEGAYTMRYLPSLQWLGDAKVRTMVPRDLQLSGFSLSTGIQIGLRVR